MENEEGTTDFEDGYSDAPAEKPELSEEPIAELKEPEVVAEEVKPDPIAELAEMKARFEKLEARTRNAEGHIGGLNHNQKQMQETLAAARAATQKVSDAPTQGQVREAIDNPQEWEALKGDFPEWATATEKYMDARMAKAGGVNVDELTTRLTAAEQIAKAAEERAIKAEEKMAQRELSRLVPDWKERNTTEFFSWLDVQPEDVRALASSWEPEDAAKVYQLHEKATKPIQSNTRQRRIEAAVTPKGTGGYAPSRNDIDEMEAGYSS